jgi:hypothetical protein
MISVSIDGSEPLSAIETREFFQILQDSTRETGHWYLLRQVRFAIAIELTLKSIEQWSVVARTEVVTCSEATHRLQRAHARYVCGGGHFRLR